MLGLLLAATVVFERVEVLEARTGVMRLRSVQAPLLEVPSLEKREPATWRESRFTRLYAVEFGLETRREESTEIEGRGVLFVAVRAGSEALVALDERLRSLLASLGADAFEAPLAGLREGSPSFLELGDISEEPSWVCALPRGLRSVGSITVYQRRTSGTSSASSSVEEEVRRLCAEMDAAAQAAAPEELRTLPSPREMKELRVDMEEASTLPPEMRREDLLPLPQGVEMSKTKAPGTRSGASSNPNESRSTYADREVEWAATTVPSSLPPALLVPGAHVSRWSLRQRERRLGAAPRDDLRTVAVRTVAFVPIGPARLPEEAPASIVPVELNRELLRDDVAQVLEAASRVDTDALEAALRGGEHMAPQWLRSEGWMTVVCRDDGTAWFGLPPTGARSQVTNAAVFCAAMERMLP